MPWWRASSTAIFPKIVMADIEVPNAVRNVRLAEVNEALVEELTEMILGMEDYGQIHRAKN